MNTTCENTKVKAIVQSYADNLCINDIICGDKNENAMLSGAAGTDNAGQANHASAQSWRIFSK